MTSVYHFAQNLWPGDRVIDADEGVLLRNVQFVDTATRVRRPVRVEAAESADIRYQYVLQPGVNRSKEERDYYMSQGDIVRTPSTPIDCTSLLVQSTPWATGDAWTADNTAALTANAVQWNITADNLLHGSFAPLRGGLELTAAFGASDANRSAQFNRVAVIRTTAGYYAFQTDGETTGQLTYKGLGAAITPATWYAVPDADTHAIAKGRNAHWTIRAYDYRTFSLLLNGVEVIPPTTVQGIIEYAGYGVYGTQAGSIGSFVNYWSITERSIGTGKPDVVLGVSGDSLTANLHGAWLNWAAEYLDAAFGMRVNGVINRAIAGNGSAAQLAKLQSEGLGGATHWTVFLGTNDAGVTPDQTVSNVSTIINIAKAGGCKVLLVIPPLFIPRALGLPTGQDPANSEKLAAHRAALLKLAGTQGVPVVDLNQVLGRQSSAHLDLWFDNIHHSSFAKRLIGLAIARGIAGSLILPMTRRMPENALPADRLMNGWTVAPGASVSVDGWCHLSGPLVAGTKTEGTQVYTLPASLRPKTTKRFLVFADASKSTLLQIQANGAMTVHQLDPTATYISLDGISYELA
ncbi:SGNH/GDSL hydrolase family protein [Microvirga sp. RSM25]|uniref:SGNH/GDSL hydrolase family protein n=1 Tax=Microvirga sp. RSM25 TaxID=3273802 RepID=UPI00384E4EE1